MVCTTPVFRAIKKHNPYAHITVVGTLKNEQILMHNKDVDKYIDVTQNVVLLIIKLRRLKFDSGIVINFDSINIATLFLGGVKSISCFSLSSAYKYAEPIPYRFMSRLVHRLEYVPGTYVPQQNLNLLRPFGIITSDTKKHLGCIIKSIYFALWNTMINDTYKSNFVKSISQLMDKFSSFCFISMYKFG